MSAVPRILIVDPVGGVARLIRAVIELSDQMSILTEVPNGAEALAELSRVHYHLLVCAAIVDENTTAFELAEQVRFQSAETRVIIIAEPQDDPLPEPMDGLLIFRRPLDPAQFLNAMIHAIDGKDPLAAVHHQRPAPEFMDVPSIDIAAVGAIVDNLLRSIAPISLILITRTGEVLLERGTERRLGRDELAQALLPAVHSTIQLGDMVGGKINAMNFYDGDSYDIYTLAVGYHHMLCLVFDGKNGVKQFGAVRNYAQRAAQDIIALLGGQAYALHDGAAPKTRKKSSVRHAPTEQQELEPVAVRADSLDEQPLPIEQTREEARLQLEPVENFDLGLLDQLESLSSADADALFDLDSLAEIAKDPGRDRGSLTYEEARRLGIMQ